MRKYAMIGFIYLVSVGAWAPGIYEYTVPTIEGSSQSLSVYEGKRLLIVTLPVEQSLSADSFLFSLDSISTLYASRFSVIGVPSLEDGYSSGQREQLAAWYRSKLGEGILITDGLYTRKTSGSQQDDLFKWLTDVNLNESIDSDVTGPGFKFFIRENGVLYSFIESTTALTGKPVHITLNLP